MKIFLVSALSFFLLYVLVIFVPKPVYADVAMSAGQDDGYSGKVMDRVIARWSPPKQLKKESSLKLVVSLDGEGNVIDCKIRKSSGLEALDVSACAAVKAAAPYGSPPYSMPADIFLSFWSGAPGNVVPPDPARQPLDTTSATIAREKSVATNERARALAEKAAQKTGKPLPSEMQPAEPKADVSLKAPRTVPETAKAKLSAGPAVAPGKVALTPATQGAKISASKPVGNAAALPVTNDKYKKYISRITWHLRKAMYIPIESKPGEYEAKVKLKCAPNGKIETYSLTQSSGDPIMDRYVLMGIKRAGHVQRPPAGYGNEFELTFHLTR